MSKSVTPKLVALVQKWLHYQAASQYYVRRCGLFLPTE